MAVRIPITDEVVACVRKRAAEGLSVTEIAARLRGHSRYSVAKICAQHGIELKPGHRSPEATETLVARIRELFANGRSQREAADEAGISYSHLRKICAVERIPTPRVRKAHGPARPAAVKPGPKKPFVFRKPKPVDDAPAAPAEPFVPIRPTVFVGVPLLDLERDQCRFPLDAVDGPQLFCGNATEPGDSYCAGCRPIAFAWTPRGDGRWQLARAAAPAA